MNDIIFWNHPGPCLCGPEYGNEPTLFQMIVKYYESSGFFTKEQSIAWANKYIENHELLQEK